MMRVIVASRSLKGAWTPGKHWGPQPMEVDADDKLLAELDAAEDFLVVYPLGEKKDSKK